MELVIISLWAFASGAALGLLLEKARAGRFK